MGERRVAALSGQLKTSVCYRLPRHPTVAGKNKKPSPEERMARAVRDELTRQLLLERRYDLVLEPRPDGVAVGRGAARALAGWEFGARAVPELEALRKKADRLLVRADGMVFNVAILDVVGRRPPFTERVPLSRLIEIGTSFTPLTGKVGGQRLPVTFQVFELFPAEISQAYRDSAAEYRRRGVATPKVGVGVVAVDATSGNTWSNFPGLVRWSHVALAKRAFRDREMSRETREALLARTGWQIERAALGVVVGTLAGGLSTYTLLQARVSRGEIYGGVLVLAAVTAAVVSLKSCRVVHATIAQTTSAGVVTAVLVCFIGIELGLEFGVSAVVTVAVAAFVSFALGAVDNPEGRAR